MDSVSATNIPEAFVECIWRIRICGKEEDTRNGPVIAMPGPFHLTVYRPWQRVLFDSVRRANPYFHMAEFIWMMAGSRDIKWIANYNKRMLEYSDDGVVQPAAYGYRWREHWGGDQIEWVVNLLREDPTTRRAVLAMWDPDMDCSTHSADLPCNTHIYFRTKGQFLNMTVCNRSNDLIWGMLGANAVHMTMLHELIATAAGLRQGEYSVFTNNLHIYKSVPNFDQLWLLCTTNDEYRKHLFHVPLLNFNEKLVHFLDDADKAVCGESGFHSEFKTEWFRRVAQPMMIAYERRKNGESEDAAIDQVMAEDWQTAAKLWKEWKSE